MPTSSPTPRIVYLTGKRSSSRRSICASWVPTLYRAMEYPTAAPER